MVPHQPVEDTAGLLRIHQISIDVAGMEKGLLHGTFGDFVEGDAADHDRVLLALLLAIDRVPAEFFGQVRGHGLPFAVGIGGQIDGIGRLRQFLQPGDDLLLAGNNHVLGGEIVVEIDAERLLGQVFDVPKRSFNHITRAEIFLDRLRLGGRFDND